MQKQGRRRRPDAMPMPEEQQARMGSRPIQPGDGAEDVARTKAQMGMSSQQEPMRGQPAPMQAAVMPQASPYMPQAATGAPIRQAIGETEVRDALTILERYKSCKASLEQRIVSNELWYRLRHWDTLKKPNSSDPEPASAWLLNSIANKHADAMDNFPTATVLAREEGDQGDAEMLTSILPTVLEQNDFESTYSDVWWYKLKTGTGVMQIVWDNDKLGGLGDISIRKVDMLNLFWEPGIKDIQDSRNLFHVELWERDDVASQWPHVAEAVRGQADVDVNKYQYDDSIPTDTKVAVVDWYYKRKSGSKTILHYCKFCAGQVLVATENDPEYAERGFYDHGKYPFVFDTLFPEEGTPVGFGYIDVCKNPQLYIDKLDSVYVKHAAMGARARFFKRVDVNVNEDDLNDWTKDVVEYEGSANPNDVFYPINVPPLDGNYISLRLQKIEELKETSGNRDFSQGGTTSGVTAASAIAALQEAGSKTSRDNIKSSYRAFQAVCYMVLDLMRQFYTEPRMFRIIGKQGEMRFVEFQGQAIGMQDVGGGFLPEASRMPYFDIRVVPQKSSPFSTVAQNERAKELYSMGFFRPDLADQAMLALDMMQFEGIERVREQIAKNGTLYQAIQELGPIALAMAQHIDQVEGTMYTQQVAMLVQRYMAVTNNPQAGAPMGSEAETNALGMAFNNARGSLAGEARKGAATRSTPKV